MYVIKRGDEVLFKNEGISELADYILSLGDMWNKNYMKIEDTDVAHLRLIGAADQHIRWHVYTTTDLVNKNIKPLAVKYGLTIEEVKDV